MAICRAILKNHCPKIGIPGVWMISIAVFMCPPLSEPLSEMIPQKKRAVHEVSLQKALKLCLRQTARSSEVSLETPRITGWLIGYSHNISQYISIIPIRWLGGVDLDHLHEKSHLLKLRSAAMAFGGPPSWENDGQRELENPAMRWRLGRIVMRVCAKNICMLCIDVSVYLYLLNHICTVWNGEKQ